MRHAKAGELFEHFNTAYLVADGQIVNEVPTYRGEGYSSNGSVAELSGSSRVIRQSFTNAYSG